MRVVRAQPYTLLPIPTAGSLGRVPRPLRTLTATQPRDSSKAGRPQTYVLDTLLLSFLSLGPCWEDSQVYQQRAQHENDLHLRPRVGVTYPQPQICHHGAQRQKGQPRGTAGVSLLTRL